MKIIIAILACLVVALGYGYVRERRQNLGLEAKVASLNAAAMSARATAPVLAPSDMAKERVACSERAAAVFKSLGYSDAGDQGAKLAGAAYTDHYNPALSRCLIQLQTEGRTEGNLVSSTTLLDADERMEFGEFSSVWNGATHETTVVACRETQPGKPAAACRSQAEWQAFAKTLME